MIKIEVNKKQKIRLINLFWAEVGALILSSVVIMAHNFNLLLVSHTTLVIYLLVFWCVNISFFIIIITGFNQRYIDPALSLPQMCWATATTLSALIFTRHFDSIYYLLIMLATAFGILKVPQKQYIIFCISQVVALFFAHLIRFYVFGEEEPFVVLFSCIAFLFCSLTLATLCTSIVKLRSKLKQNNASLTEALNVKSRFLATMSHEIRTPMNGVIGMLDITLQKETDADKKNYLNIAYSSAQSLLNIINDILSFAKIENNEIEIEETPTNIEKIIADTALIFSSIASKKGVIILCKIDPKLPESINIDNHKFRQIINNLVNNAVKFTENGHILIHAKCAYNASNKFDRIHIDISDTGIGIAKELQESIFKPFTQADSSTTRLYGGTGLGLCIANELAQAMGSPISLTSKKNAGSHFSFFVNSTHYLSNTLKSVYSKPHKFSNFFIFSQYEPLSDNIITYLQELNIRLDSTPLTNDTFLTKVKRFTSYRNDMSVKSAFIVIALNDIKKSQDKTKIQYVFNLLSRLNSSAKTAIPLLIIGENTHYNFNHICLSKSIPTCFSLKQLTTSIYTLSNMHYEEPIITPIIDIQTDPIVKPNTIDTSMSKNNLNVLIVDDNAVNLEVARLIVEPLGYNVQTVMDGEEALDALRHTLKSNEMQFDLILMDCQMPRMDGYQATRAIRTQKEFETIKDIPIIAITANAMEGDKEKCINAGMNDYASKPIKAEEQKRLLNKWAPINVSEKQKTETANESTSYLNPQKNTPLWNKQELLKLLGGNENRITQLVKSFLDELQTTEPALTHYLNNKNWDDLQKAIHTLKGSSANMRMYALSEKSLEVEKTIKNKEYKAVQAALLQLYECIESTQNIIYSNTDIKA